MFFLEKMFFEEKQEVGHFVAVVVGKSLYIVVFL